MVTRIGPRNPIRIFLIEWREHKGLTQTQLADRIGTTKGTISRWENSSRDVTLGALGAIAEALGIDASDLYRDPSQTSADALLRDASEDVRKQAFKVIEALAKTG